MSERQTGATDDEVPWSTEPTTGATEHQIEQGAINAWGYDPELPEWGNALDEDKYPIRADARWWAGNLVPPGQVITDATAVPTAEELAALRVILRELDSADMIEHLDKNDAPGWGYPYDAVDTLRAYLERQR